jgi:hypothetical protein
MTKEDKIWELSVKKYELIDELKSNQDSPVEIINKYLKQIQEIEDERAILRMT